MENITPFQAATFLLLETFKKYAGAPGDDDKDTLTAAEFKTLVNAEMPMFAEGEGGPKRIDELMKGLDVNNDQRIDFMEYMGLVASLTMVMHELSKQ